MFKNLLVLSFVSILPLASLIPSEARADALSGIATGIYGSKDTGACGMSVPVIKPPFGGRMELIENPVTHEKCKWGPGAALLMTCVSKSDCHQNVVTTPVGAPQGVTTWTHYHMTQIDSNRFLLETRETKKVGSDPEKDLTKVTNIYVLQQPPAGPQADGGISDSCAAY